MKKQYAWIRFSIILFCISGIFIFAYKKYTPSESDRLVLREVKCNGPFDSPDNRLFAASFDGDSLTLFLQNKVDSIIFEMVSKMYLDSNSSFLVSVVRETDETKNLKVEYGDGDATNIHNFAPFLVGYNWKNGRFVYKIDDHQHLKYNISWNNILPNLGGIKFSHKFHAGTLKIDCGKCHSPKSDSPPLVIGCASCHK